MPNNPGFADDVAEVQGERVRSVKAGAQVAAAGTAINGRYYNVTGRSQTLKNVHVALGTAPTGSSFIVDVKKNGATVYATGKPTVAAGANAGQAAPPSAVEVADGDFLTFEVTQVGSTVAGSDLVITAELDG